MRPLKAGGDNMNDHTIKILAISGSLRYSSSNTNLIRAAADIAQQEKMIFTIYGGLGDLPHFNPDLDGDEPPAAVSDLRKQLKAADGVLICTPAQCTCQGCALIIPSSIR
jgi:chromate reductase